ncbi:MAG: PAS domain-containing sensor histidine kinase [Alphaproteobacteria bacterium]|nr:PAS domain-containing sensor histidine kinase [Alphaproteobacteria bacterium]
MDKKKSKLLRRVRSWARKVRLAKKLSYVMTIAAILSVFATFATFSHVGPFLPTSTTLFILLSINLCILLILGAMVARQIVQLRATHKTGAGSSRLHRRIITLFSIIAITPTIIVAITSGVFFEFGLQSWFSNKVRTALDDSLAVAEAYIEEHKKAIQADILGVARDLNSQAFTLSQNPQLLARALTIQAQFLSLSEAIVFDRNGHVTARAKTTLTLTGDSFPIAALDLAAKGNIVPIIGGENDDRVRVLVALDGFIGHFLYISRFVDPRALALVKSTKDARSDYMVALKEQSQYRLWFDLTYILIAFLVLLAAIWLGIDFAKKLMDPITNLVDASEKVGRGDFTARAPIKKDYDDLGGLTRAFNKMTRQLGQQQQDIRQANIKLEERHRFMEAVLSGVSAGIMGLDPSGKVTLPNKAAANMLNLETDQITGAKIQDIMPEVEELFNKIRLTENPSVQNHVVIERDGIDLNLMVRITAETRQEKIQGFVIAFDDITEQVAAQRTAAWSDIARRIAHEIKNPLTPIQLSAERLKRKYFKEITSDPKVFTQCTDTIVRQVGNLRHMVDEFSSFARMPAPNIRLENLAEITRQAFFLQEGANNRIHFELDCAPEELTIECDAGQIGQALTNIIKNATESIAAMATEKENNGQKYQGRIKLILQDKARETRILVTDNGMGLPEHQMDKLIEPYITTRAKGTGLGLAIVKKIMTDHGGDLHLENNIDEGATVSLVFYKNMKFRENIPSDGERLAYGS